MTFGDLETASAVLLVALEPEEESPSIFLRLRKSNRANGTPVYALAPFATRGLEKVNGTLLPVAPGTEAEVLRAMVEHPGDEGLLHEAIQALDAGAVILVGERLAMVPGGLSAVAALAESTGARLAWVPRRAGERGAVEAGALPNLLPGGRPLGDATVAAAWGAELPQQPGRDSGAIFAAAASGELSALLVAGVDPDDMEDPRTARAGLEKAFVVSLDLRESAVHEYADVILPVAPQQEKSGSFVNWEGRVRPFQQALDSNARSDAGVLDLLAGAMGIALGTLSVDQVRTELEGLAGATDRPAAPQVPASGPPRPAQGEAVLATWHHLLDLGSLQDGEPFLAGTAKTPVARLSPATAAAAGVAEGDPLLVSTDQGALTLPVALTEMPDHVVWVPTNSTGSRVRATLGVDAGAVVRVGAAEHTGGVA